MKKACAVEESSAKGTKGTTCNSRLRLSREPVHVIRLRTGIRTGLTGGGNTGGGGTEQAAGGSG